MHYNVDFFLIITRGAHELHVYLGILGSVSEPNETRIEFIGQKVWKSAVNRYFANLSPNFLVLHLSAKTCFAWPDKNFMQIVLNKGWIKVEYIEYAN